MPVAGRGRDGARLQWQVQLRHDGVVRGHGLDGLGQEVLGMARHESNALDARLSGQGEHLGEPRPSVEVPAIRVDVLSEQRDLANALGGKPGEFRGDALDRA